MQEDEKIDARDQRDGDWSWVQNAIYYLFLPIIGREATHLYQVMTYLIPERIRNPNFDLTIRKIAQVAMMSKSNVDRQLKVLHRVGLMPKVSEDPPLFVLADLRKLAKLGEKEIRRRFVPQGDNGDEGGGSDAPPDGSGEGPQGGAGGRDTPPNGSTPGQMEATSPEGSGGGLVPQGDKGTDLGPECENRQNVTLAGLVLSLKQGGLVPQEGVFVPEKGGSCPSGGTPFNVLNLSIQKDLKTNTSSPQAGKREISPITTEANGEGKKLPLGKQLAAAAQRAMFAHGFTPDRYTEAEIAKAFGRWCEETGRTPDEAVEFEEKSFRAWLEVETQMFHNWGWRFWFKQGYWAKPEQWPYDRQKLKELRSRGGASIGHYEPRESGAFEREQAEQIGTHLARVAAAIEAANIEPAVVERLGEIAASLDVEPNLERLDRELVELEEKLFSGLLASASEAELAQLREQGTREARPWQGKMQAQQIEQMQRQLLQKRLLEARGLPRLSLFYMASISNDDGQKQQQQQERSS